MYIEGLEIEFGDADPEWGGPDWDDPYDRPIAPDISTLAGPNVIYAQFGR